MEKMCLKVSYVTIVVNFVLSCGKFIAGIFGHSNSMISDSVHSMSDVLSTVIVIIGIKLSARKSDQEHQYGHERMENVASIILAFMLLLTGLMIGVNGIKNIYNNEFIVPNFFALIFAVISIAVKEWMYWYTIIVAKKVNSDALKADAWHHRSDALSSVGSFIGIGGAMLGFKSLDVIASIIIALIIVKVSIDIFIDAIKKMVDCSCNEGILKKIEDVVSDTEGVLGIDDMKSRLFGNKVYIDLEITASKSLSFEQAHEIAHEVHDRVENNIENIKHCMVHVNPK